MASSVQVHNPRRKRRKGGARRRRRNPAAASVVAANPRRRRRRNPGPVRVASVENPRRRRRNPRRGGFRGAVGSVGSNFKQALPVVFGIYASRYLVRALLKEKDRGVAGYAANAAAGVALAAGARMVGQGKAAPGIATGAMAAVILRIITDRVPSTILPGISDGSFPLSDYLVGGPQGQHVPWGGRLSGLGIPELDLDPRYAQYAQYAGYGYPVTPGAGMYGVSGLGDYLNR